jgi:hypothetical protein
MLHLSRAAICSTVATVPATSSSQSRPRAVAAMSVARVSARMGRQSCGDMEAGTMISRRRFIGVFFHGMRMMAANAEQQAEDEISSERNSDAQGAIFVSNANELTHHSL